MQSSLTRASGMVALVVALATALVCAPPRVHGNRREARWVRSGVQRQDYDSAHHDADASETSAVGAPVSPVGHLVPGSDPALDDTRAAKHHAAVRPPGAAVHWHLAAVRLLLPTYAPPALIALLRPPPAGRAPPTT
jgi:hypothetical protein